MSVSLLHGGCCLLAVLVVVACPSSAGAASDVYGFTEPNQVVSVASADSVLLVELLVSEGAQVTEGQPLAKLDDAVLRATLKIADQARKARGRLESAQADLRLKTERAERLEQLRQRKHARQEEVDRAAVERELAAAQVVTVQEELALRELEYQRTLVQIEQRTVRAPLSGTVIEIVKQPGEFVSPVTPVIMNIAQLDPLLAVFSTPSKRVSELKPGAPVKVTIAQTTLHGSVEFISPQIEPQTGTVQVKVSIPNPERARPSGERCRLHLTGQPEDVAESPHTPR